MRLLLDTHSFLWFILDDPQLSPAARDAVEDLRNEVLISPASYWEIAIKIKLGKYHLARPFAEFIERQIVDNELQILPILPKHASLLTTLPAHHKDPFDRMLVAQALVESIPIVSIDAALDPYGVRRMW